MFFPEGQTRVQLYGQPADMRKSFDGLQTLTRQGLGADPLDGALYVFINRRATQMRVLYFDRSGFRVWAKRLEAGRFISDWRAVRTREMDWAGLKPLLEGIEPVRQRKRYRHVVNRAQQRLIDAGITVSRPWLTQLSQQSIALLEPIYEAQLDSIRESRVKAMDETPIKAGRVSQSRQDEDRVFLAGVWRARRSVLSLLPLAVRAARAAAEQSIHPSVELRARAPPGLGGIPH